MCQTNCIYNFRSVPIYIYNCLHKGEVSDLGKLREGEVSHSVELMGQTFEAGLAMLPAFSEDIAVNWNRQEANNTDAKCSNIQEVASANSCL